MRAAFNLWLLLRRRDAGRSDPQHLTGVLAVIAFAVTTAVTLVVVGGWHAFAERAAAGVGGIEAGTYPMLAGIASALLLVPLSALGGAAARLAVARRDERLAALRLAGASTSQVSLLTLLDAATQALTGALIGVAGYFGLIPLVTLVVFQDLPFSYSELVAPVWMIALAVLAVVLIALFSAGASLRKVAITPLGVAARVSPRPLHWTRLVPIVLAVVGFSVYLKTPHADAEVATMIIVLAAFVVGGFALLNLLGPLVIGVIGKMWAKRATELTTLIAARRLIDSPKTAWRSVGGVGLATFIAGMTAAIAMFASGDTAGDPMVRDMSTGGFLTLAIAAITAAVSTGVMQSGRVIDQRNEYRALSLAGTDLRVMNKARMAETRIPLIAAVVVATAAAGLFLLPALGTSLLTSGPVLLQYLLSVAGAVALVLAGSAASGRVVRTVLQG